MLDVCNLKFLVLSADVFAFNARGAQFVKR